MKRFSLDDIRLPQERWFYPYYYERQYRQPNKYRDWLRDFPQIVVYPRDAEQMRGKWQQTGFKSVCVDVGCAEGDFLIQQAALNKQSLFVGIELKFKRLYKAARKIEKNDLQNVRLVRYDANFLYRIFDAQEVATLFVLFPDPWAKRKKQKHRIFNIHTLKVWHYLLEPQGVVEVKTDHTDYFEAIKAVMSQKEAQELFVVDSISDDVRLEPEKAAHLAKTRYEREFEEQGLPIHYLRLRKRY